PIRRRCAWALAARRTVATGDTATAAASPRRGDEEAGDLSLGVEGPLHEDRRAELREGGPAQIDLVRAGHGRLLGEHARLRPELRVDLLAELRQRLLAAQRRHHLGIHPFPERVDLPLVEQARQLAPPRQRLLVDRGGGRLLGERGGGRLLVERGGGRLLGGGGGGGFVGGGAGTESTQDESCAEDAKVHDRRIVSTTRPRASSNVRPILHLTKPITILRNISEVRE